MNEATGLKGFEFHDSTLISAFHEGDRLDLEIEYYNDEDEESLALARIVGIEAIMLDGKPVEPFVMRGDDAEILDVSRQDDRIDLTVIWSSRGDATWATYNLIGRRLGLSLSPAA